MKTIRAILLTCFLVLYPGSAAFGIDLDIDLEDTANGGCLVTTLAGKNHGLSVQHYCEYNCNEGGFWHLFSVVFACACKTGNEDACFNCVNTWCTYIPPSV